MIRYYGRYLMGEAIVKAVKNKGSNIRYDKGMVKVSNGMDLDDYLRSLISIYKPEVVLYLKRPYKNKWKSFHTWLKRIPMTVRMRSFLRLDRKFNWILDYIDEQDRALGWSDYYQAYVEASLGWSKIDDK